MRTQEHEFCLGCLLCKMHPNLQFHPVGSNTYVINITITFFVYITGVQIFDPAWHAWFCRICCNYVVNGMISEQNVFVVRAACFDFLFSVYLNFCTLGRIARNIISVLTSSSAFFWHKIPHYKIL